MAMSAKEVVEKVVHSALVGAVFLGGVASRDSIATMWGAGAILAGVATAMKREISEMYEDSQAQLQSPSSTEELEQKQELEKLTRSFTVMKQKLDQIAPVAVPAVMTAAGIATMNPAAMYAGVARLSDHYLSRHVLAETEHAANLSSTELNLPRSDCVEGRSGNSDWETSKSLYTQLQLQADTALPGASSFSDSVADYLSQDVEIPDSRIATDIAIAGACEERELDTHSVLQHSPLFQNLAAPQNDRYLEKVVSLAQAIRQDSRSQVNDDIER